MGKSNSKEYAIVKASKEESESRLWGLGFPKLSHEHRSVRKSAHLVKVRLRHSHNARGNNQTLLAGSLGRETNLMTRQLEEIQKVDVGSQSRASKVKSNETEKNGSLQVGSQGRKSELLTDEIQKSRSMEAGSQSRKAKLKNHEIGKSRSLDTGSQGQKSRYKNDSRISHNNTPVGNAESSAAESDDVVVTYVSRADRLKDTTKGEHYSNQDLHELSKDSRRIGDQYSDGENQAGRSNQKRLDGRDYREMVDGRSLSKQDYKTVITRKTDGSVSASRKFSHTDTQSPLAAFSQVRHNYVTIEAASQAAIAKLDRPKAEVSATVKTFDVVVRYDKMARLRLNSKRRGESVGSAAKTISSSEKMTENNGGEVSTYNRSLSKRTSAELVPAAGERNNLSHNRSLSKGTSAALVPAAGERDVPSYNRSLSKGTSAAFVPAAGERDVPSYNHSLSKGTSADLVPSNSPGTSLWEPATVLRSEADVQEFTSETKRKVNDAHARASLRNPRKRSANPETRKSKSLDRDEKPGNLPIPRETVPSEPLPLKKHVAPKAEDSREENDFHSSESVKNPNAREQSEQSPYTDALVDEVKEPVPAVQPKRPTTLNVTPYSYVNPYLDATTNSEGALNSDGASNSDTAHVKNQRKLLKVNIPAVGDVVIRKDGLLRKVDKRSPLLSNPDASFDLHRVIPSSSLPRSPSSKESENSNTEKHVATVDTLPQVDETTELDESPDSVFDLLPPGPPSPSQLPPAPSELPPVIRSKKPNVQRPQETFSRLPPSPPLRRAKKLSSESLPEVTSSIKYSYYPPIRFDESPEEHPGSYESSLIDDPKSNGKGFVGGPKSPTFTYPANIQVSLLPEIAMPPDSAKPRSVTVSAVSVPYANARHKQLAMLNVETPDEEGGSVRSYGKNRKNKHVSFNNILVNIGESSSSALVVYEDSAPKPTAPRKVSDPVVAKEFPTNKLMVEDPGSFGNDTQVIEAGTVRQRIAALRKTIE